MPDLAILGFYPHRDDEQGINGALWLCLDFLNYRDREWRQSREQRFTSFHQP